jgi:hypothetical protein
VVGEVDAGEGIGAEVLVADSCWTVSPVIDRDAMIDMERRMKMNI